MAHPIILCWFYLRGRWRQGRQTERERETFSFYFTFQISITAKVSNIRSQDLNLVLLSGYQSSKCLKHHLLTTEVCVIKKQALRTDQGYYISNPAWDVGISSSFLIASPVLNSIMFFKNNFCSKSVTLPNILLAKFWIVKNFILCPLRDLHRIYYCFIFCLLHIYIFT